MTPEGNAEAWFKCLATCIKYDANNIQRQGAFPFAEKQATDGHFTERHG
jgi:hypothetical protein